jgi:hypothetical protein
VATTVSEEADILRVFAARRLAVTISMGLMNGRILRADSQGFSVCKIEEIPLSHPVFIAFDVEALTQVPEPRRLQRRHLRKDGYDAHWGIFDDTGRLKVMINFNSIWAMLGNGPTSRTTQKSIHRPSGINYIIYR